MRPPDFSLTGSDYSRISSSKQETNNIPKLKTKLQQKKPNNQKPTTKQQWISLKRGSIK